MAPKPDYDDIQKARFPRGEHMERVLARAIYLETMIAEVIAKRPCLNFSTSTCKEVGYAQIYWCPLCQAREELK